MAMLLDWNTIGLFHQQMVHMLLVSPLRQKIRCLAGQLLLLVIKLLEQNLSMRPQFQTLSIFQVLVPKLPWLAPGMLASTSCGQFHTKQMLLTIKSLAPDSYQILLTTYPQLVTSVSLLLQVKTQTKLLTLLCGSMVGLELLRLPKTLLHSPGLPASWELHL